MPLYRVRAADGSGVVQEIVVEGLHPEEATRRVQQRGWLPIELVGLGAAPRRTWWPRRGAFDVVEFTERLAPLLAAQIPLEQALRILEETGGAGPERTVVAALRQGLHEGRRLSQVLRDQGRQFPAMYASIVEAGEEAGALPQVVGQLKDFLLMTRELRNYLISAAIYPLFVLGFSALVVAILLGVVVPKLATVILSTGAPPALGTQVLMLLATGVRGYWWLAPLALAGAVLGWRTLDAQPWWVAARDAALLRLPGLRRLVLLANLARLLRTMALLTRSGVPVLETMAIAAGVLQNATLRQSLTTVAGDLRRGERLSAALSRSPYLPPLVIRMLAVGEETGATEVMLERVAERYEAELRQTVKRVLAWFEPLTILLLGGIVGTIILMMFLAILDMWGRL